MRPQILIPSNPGVLNKITFPGGYDLKDLAFFLTLGLIVAAIFLAPILIVFENDPDFTLIYQIVAYFGIWIVLTVFLIRRWFGRESAWKVFIHIFGFVFRKKRHVFYVFVDEKPITQKNSKVNKPVKEIEMNKKV